MKLTPAVNVCVDATKVALPKTMDVANFFIWLIFIAAVAGIGYSVMFRAYIGAGSYQVLFKEAVPASQSLAETEAVIYFQQGYDSYESGKYRQAIDKFTKAIQLLSTFAEAYHNRGLAFANLRQDDEATSNLLKASEFYLQQVNQEGMAIIKQNFDALKARKLARENRTTGSE